MHNMETAEDEEVGGPLAPTDVVDILVDKDEGSPSTTSAVPLLVKSPSSPTAVGRRKGSSGIRKPNYDAIKCPCGDEEDDGFTIQCEGCLAWQHARCVSIQRHAVPERYFCAKCRQSKAAKKLLAQQSRKGPPTPGRPLVGEIRENIVGSRVGKHPGLLGLLGHYKNVLARMPQCRTGWRTVNFEMAPELVALPERACLAEATPPGRLEVREIRGAGSVKDPVWGKPLSSTRPLGVFCLEMIDPGALVVEYLGHLMEMQQETNPHMLSVYGGALAVDARRFGSVARYVRRSCRPNCEIKTVLTGSDGPANVHLCLFATVSIYPGEEVLLPMATATSGTRCACGNQDLCLSGPGGPTMTFSVRQSKVRDPRDSEQSQQNQRRADAQPRSSSIVSTPSATTITSSNSNPAFSSRKLTREERKLQQYIEYFEKMESAERKHSIRRSQSQSGGSSGHQSPQPQEESKRTADEPDLKDMESQNLGEDSPTSPAQTSKRKRVDSKKREPKRAGQPKQIHTEEEEELPVIPESLPERSTPLSQILTDEHDIEKDKVVVADNVTDNNGEVAADNDDITTNNEPPNIPSQPETPSKKRLSFSDYLRKKRSSPATPQ